MRRMGMEEAWRWAAGEMNQRPRLNQSLDDKDERENENRRYDQQTPSRERESDSESKTENQGEISRREYSSESRREWRMMKEADHDEGGF